MNGTILPRIKKVRLAGGYRLTLFFSTGESGEVDLADSVLGGPGMLGELADPELFARVKVDGGTVAWPKGIDLDPIVLYCEATRTPIREIIPWAEETETTKHFT